MQLNRAMYRLEYKSGNVWFLHQVYTSKVAARNAVARTKKNFVYLAKLEFRTVKVLYTLAEIHRLKRDVTIK